MVWYSTVLFYPEEPNMQDDLVTPKHRTAKGKQRLDELVEVAAQLFLERGFEGVAVDELIARVGGSRRNVYAHFGGKEGLFIESVTQLCEELARPLTQLKIDNDQSWEGLQVFGCKLLQTALQPRALALHRLMIAEGARFPELSQAILKAGHLNATTILAGWIESTRNKPEGAVGSHLPSITLAQQFVDLVVTAPQLRALVGLDPHPLTRAQIRKIVIHAVDIFLHGAAPRRTIHDME
jgi:AcrR family transcriptional regulator